jgi:hypothetical protein
VPGIWAGIGIFGSANIPCESGLARESGESGNINVECADAFASKLGSYRGFVLITEFWEYPKSVWELG